MARLPSSNDASSAADLQQRRISRKRDATPSAQLPVPPSQTAEGYFPGGLAQEKGPSVEERTGGQRREQSRSLAAQSRPSKDYQQLQRVKSTPNSPSNFDDPNDTTIIASSPPSERPGTPGSKSVTPVPANVMRYSLSDNPVPSVLIDGATPPTSSESIAAMSQDRHSSTSSSNPTSTPPETPQVEPEQQPFIDSSLAALKKSEALERRASKRFSTYNISKMTGTGLRERGIGMGKHANRRSMAADSTSLTPGDLTVLTEEDEAPKPASDGPRPKARDIGRMRTPTPIEEEVPPVPALPSSASSSSLNPPPLVSRSSSDSLERRKEALISAAGSVGTDSDSSGTLTVFLQLGREVKKVSVEKGLSFSSLRVLFVDKFSYSPGKGNFPDIYIRDPSSGVMYELEDVDEVKDKCLLSLNIDRESFSFCSIIQS